MFGLDGITNNMFRVWPLLMYILLQWKNFR